MNDEVNPQLLIIVIVEHHKRGAPDEVRADAKVGIDGAGWKLGEVGFDGLKNEGTLFGNYTSAEFRDTLTE